MGKGNVRNMLKNNTFHARIILLILWCEKKFLIKLPFRIIRKVVLQMIYNCEIHPHSFVDMDALTSFRLPHPYTIVIHKLSKIHANCVIFQGVTIGIVEREETEKKAPILYNGVYIGCKASLLGELTIAEGTKIGAHALVLKSVTVPNQTVVGLYK